MSLEFLPHDDAKLSHQSSGKHKDLQYEIFAVVILNGLLGIDPHTKIVKARSSLHKSAQVCTHFSPFQL